MSEPDSSYVRSRVCRAAEQPWLCISDEKVLTQFSRNANKYLSEPRYAREREISLLTGKLTIEQAARYVLRSVFPPWRPRPEASDLDVWHEYEIPLTGTFRLNEDLILFKQVAAATEERSAWAYLCIDPDDAELVENADFSSLDEMDAFVEDRFAGREVVIALADGDKLLDLWTRETIDSGGLPQALESALNKVIQSVNHVDEQERRIRAKLAGVEAATAELDLLSA